MSLIFDFRYDSGYNQDVSKALQEKLMTVIKIPEKEAKAVSFAKFRCLQNMSRRSQAYMRANAKRTMKQNVSIFVTSNFLHHVMEVVLIYVYHAE